MAYCANCGNPMAEDAEFCAGCGQPAGKEGAAATTETPPAPSYAPPAAPPPETGTWAPPQPHRSRKWLWIALAALVVVVAIVLVLVLVVFNGDDGGEATGPEQAVTQMLDALEKQDINAVFDLMDPESMGGSLGELGEDFIDMAKEAMGEELFGGVTLDFSGVKLVTEMTGEGSATVTMTEGTVTVTEADGSETTEDVKEADSPVEFFLVERDGKWYLEPESLEW